MGTNKVWRALKYAAATALSALVLQACGGGSGDPSQAASVKGEDQGPMMETRQGNAARAAVPSRP